MRVLLIDNHDSFTFNLAHDIAAVTGAMPDVVPHDADLPSSVGDWLTGYDAVVVSPGPGTPESPRDLGHSLAAVQQGEVPVLGVCLGMQAIGWVAGARVVRAPRPVHGEVALVEHDGGGLFAGLPDPLPMVRYHSLVLADVPDEIVVDATCEGLVMGLHHRTRPQWGVQTHPESISSEHGRDIIRTFLSLAQEWNSAHTRTATPQDVTPRPDASGPATPKDGRTILARRLDLPEGVTDETVFDAVFRREDHAWWLDSATGGGFSACGSAAGPLARVATLRPDGLRVRDRRGERAESSDVLDLVAADIGAPRAVDDEGKDVDLDGLPFALGWVGYLGYEYGTGVLLGESPGRVSVDETPLATLLFADRAVVVVDGVAWVLALLGGGDAGEEQRAWVETTAARMTSLTADGPRADDLPPAPAVDRVTIRHDAAAYRDLVARCLEEIAAGESYELCLTNRITVQAHTDSWDLYRRLRGTSPRPFAAYLAFDGGHVLSASPERFVSVDADGVVEAKPIKGTRRRGSTPEEDARLAAELASDVKERAENLMIVDLLRHDLSRVCEPGSVHVPLLFDVETHVGVHQLVSTIRGRLRPGTTAVDAVRAALPGGSMTGAPKERSVRLLRDLDGGPRGIYSGVVGYVSLTGVADWSIVIRTIVHHPDHLTYGVGGAVTARSDAQAEWEETLVKARTLGAALGVDLDPLIGG